MSEPEATESLPALSHDPLTPFSLTEEEQAQIYGLMEENKLTHVQIAERFGCSRQNIQYYSRQMMVVTPKLLLRSKGLKLAHAWLRAVPEAEKRGDIRPMERALLYGGHLEPIETGANRPVMVQIGVVITPPTVVKDYNIEPVDAIVVPGLGVL